MTHLNFISSSKQLLGLDPSIPAHKCAAASSAPSATDSANMATVMDQIVAAISSNSNRMDKHHVHLPSHPIFRRNFMPLALALVSSLGRAPVLLVFFADRHTLTDRAKHRTCRTHSQRRLQASAQNHHQATTRSCPIMHKASAKRKLGRGELLLRERKSWKRDGRGRKEPPLIDGINHVHTCSLEHFNCSWRMTNVLAVSRFGITNSLVS